MQQLSQSGQQAVNDIAGRHGFSPDAVMNMLHAVMAGNGGMAQFGHPEFGGSGQWIRGGMTMIGDMFNSTLKGRVVSLAEELATLVANEPGLRGAGSFQSQNQGSQQQANYGGQRQQQAGSGSGSLFVPGGGGNWWPSELGWASSTGAQNNMRYAYFADGRRLAIDAGGRVTIYDTLDNQIGGVSQQQGQGGSLTFTSQYGSVDIGSLPVVSGDASRPSPAPPARSSSFASSGDDVFATIEKLAELRGKGIISDDEFNAKKADLLGRL